MFQANRKFSLNIFAAIIIGFCVASFPIKAHAYLDPGTGSYILQLAIVTLVGALFAVKMFCKKLLAKVKNLFSRAPHSGNGNTE